MRQIGVNRTRSVRQPGRNLAISILFSQQKINSNDPAFPKLEQPAIVREISTNPIIFTRSRTHSRISARQMLIAMQIPERYPLVNFKIIF